MLLLADMSETGALFATLIAALVAAWVAFKKQQRLDRDSTLRQWKLYAADLKAERDEAKQEAEMLSAENVKFAVEIARLTERQAHHRSEGQP